MSRQFFRSFAGGEVTPEFYSQLSDVKFQTGLATCRNFLVKPHGPVENRPGTAYVAATKSGATRKSRLIGFTYSNDQTMVVELGHLYIRFYTQGATLLSGGTPYEIASPYVEADLFSINYVQSADVMTLVHPNYPPKELKRLGATSWTLTNIAFTPAVAAPASPVATPNGGGTGYTQKYVITTLATDGFTESVKSAEASCTNNLLTTGCTNTVSWAAATGAWRYNVYKYQGGLYGYIGQTDTLSIVDDNINPDLGKTPPIYDTVFNAAGEYPAAVSYFEQRRCFAGTTNKPQNIWMTRSGTESQMSYSLPIHDDDRIAFRVAAREANNIRHILPLNQMILLTGAAEWRVTSVNSDAVTPTTISVRPQSYVGANNVQPAIVNNNMLYVSAAGGHVREMAYNWQAGGYLTGDVSLRAPHLFDSYDLTDLTFTKAPYPIVWFVSNTGKLLGLTYVPEQQVGAWHQHDTDGVFESCAAVNENGETRLYVIVKRTINSATVRYVEALESRSPLILDQTDSWFVDCGLMYSGAPATSITGLGHLEGKVVSILADGAVHPQRTVSSGAITLQNAASKVIIGLPITADIVTLPLSSQTEEGFGQGKPKNVNKAWLRVVRSRGIFVGPSFDKLREVKQRTNEPFGTPPALKTGMVSVALDPAWADDGQICIRQTDPLPLTITGIALDNEEGG